MSHDGFEQGFDRIGFVVGMIFHDALAGDAVEDREIQLFVGRFQRQKEIIDQIHDDFGALVLLIDLVDEEDRFQSEFERLLKDEARLRHRPFAGIHKQDDGVDGTDDPFDFA